MVTGNDDRKRPAENAQTARDRRLAAALRENLRRRKAQERARAAGQRTEQDTEQPQEKER